MRSVLKTCLVVAAFASLPLSAHSQDPAVYATPEFSKVLVKAWDYVQCEQGVLNAPQRVALREAPCASHRAALAGALKATRLTPPQATELLAAYDNIALQSTPLDRDDLELGQASLGAKYRSPKARRVAQAPSATMNDASPAATSVPSAAVAPIVYVPTAAPSAKPNALDTEDCWSLIVQTPAGVQITPPLVCQDVLDPR